MAKDQFGLRKRNKSLAKDIPSRVVFAAILRGLAALLTTRARLDKAFRKRVALKSGIVQIRTRDGRVSRYFVFRDGSITSNSGIHAAPDVVLALATAELGIKLMTPP